jgi:hypothetical protein
VHHHGYGQRANPVIGAVQNQLRLADLLLGIEPNHTEVGNQRREHWGQALGQRRAYDFARRSGDRAIGLVSLDQQACQSGEGKLVLATGRLSITAQRVDGQWKTGRSRVILIAPR